VEDEKFSLLCIMHYFHSFLKNQNQWQIKCLINLVTKSHLMVSVEYFAHYPPIHVYI